MNGVPKWRLAAGALVLTVLVFFAVVLLPIYWRAFAFRRYVSNLTQNVETRHRDDEALRGLTLAKAHSLNLPVTESRVQIIHEGKDVRIDVHYLVKVDLPGYAVELHF